MNEKAKKSGRVVSAASTYPVSLSSNKDIEQFVRRWSNSFAFLCNKEVLQEKEDYESFPEIKGADLVKEYEKMQKKFRKDLESLCTEAKRERVEQFIEALNQKWEEKTVGPQLDTFFDRLFNESVDEAKESLKEQQS